MENITELLQGQRLDVAPEVMASLQARITAKLARSNVFEEIHEIIQEYMGTDDDDDNNVVNNNNNNNTGGMMNENNEKRSSLPERVVLEELVQFVESQSQSVTGAKSRKELKELTNAVHAYTDQQNSNNNHGKSSTSSTLINKVYLRCHIGSGKAFHTQLVDKRTNSMTRYFQLHLSLNGERAVSKSVVADVEPTFNQTFFFPIENNNNHTSTGNGIPESSTEWDTLMGSNQFLNLCLTQHTVTSNSNVKEGRGSTGSYNKSNMNIDQAELVATTAIDWRYVFLKRNVTFAVELQPTGPDSLLHGAHGLLQISMDCIPYPEMLPLPPAEIQHRIDHFLSQISENNRLFYLYAKDWWREFIQINPSGFSDNSRPIKIFAQDETGQYRCVCSYLTMIRAGRMLDTPRHAARFVSLIPYEKSAFIGGKSNDIWHTFHAFLSRKRGDVEDHVLLLCSLLLGYGLDAYVVIGSITASYDSLSGGNNSGNGNEKEHMWVMTKSYENGNEMVYFWESLTGQRYRIHNRTMLSSTTTNHHRSHHQQKTHHFKTIACAFNDKRFLANKNEDSQVSSCSFDFEDELYWRAMDEKMIAGVSHSFDKDLCLKASTMEPVSMADKLEHELQVLLARYRFEQGMETKVDEQLSYLLQSALAAYEIDKLTGIASFGNDDFQAGIRRHVPSGHCFKGFPTCVSFCDAGKIMHSLQRSPVALEILNTRGDYVRFAIRAKIVVYPEDICAVWLMVAVRFQPQLGSNN